MRKWYLLTVAMLLAFAGCGQSGSVEQVAETKAVATIETEPDAPAEAEGEPSSPREETAIVEPVQRPVPLDAEDQPVPERFVLLAPGGPLVVEVAMTIDGRPLRHAMQRIADAVLEAADTDGDGRPTWAEVVASPRFIYGQFGNLPINNEAEGRRAVELYDANRNGEVDRREVPRFVSRNRGSGRPFSLKSSNYFRGYNRYESPLRRLLDANRDGYLSAAEMSAAPAGLRSRDADEDQTLTADELQPATGANAAAMPRRRRGGPQVAKMLGPDTSWNVLLYELEELYATGGELKPDSFPLVPGLFAQLDGDQDGRLDEEEIAALASIAPHVELEAHFGAGGSGADSAPRLVLKSLAADFGAAAEFASERDDVISLELPGMELELFVTDVAPATDNAATAATQLAVVDADRNGYVDRKEVESAGQRFAAQFDAVDADADGKVYAEELAAYLSQQQAVVQSQIRARAGDQADALFAALDRDNDGRLRGREIAHATQRLQALDGNGDGRLHYREIPGSFAVGLTRGDQPSGEALFARPSARATKDAAGPSWFVGMDANGDGDVSPHEFLGTPAQFQRLDTNADGFIEPQEAEHAAEPAT